MPKTQFLFPINLLDQGLQEEAINEHFDLINSGILDSFAFVEFVVAFAQATSASN